VFYPEEGPNTVEPEVTHGKIGVEPIVEVSHPGEGILLKKPRSKVNNDELPMLRYLFKIPQSVEVRSPKVYERINWVIPSWVTLYELMFKDAIRLSIPKLVRGYVITTRSLQTN